MKISELKKISIIIPTHNRESSLNRVLDNIVSLNAMVNFEIIVVDNNSKDGTKELVKSYNNIQYVFEKNTSFTAARRAGANHASGKILLYFDDDVIVGSGTLEEVVRIFSEYPDCAVAGGKVLPLFEQESPEWINELQKSFNGFSLYDLGENVKEVGGVPGPMMAIRKSVYDKVGGFPPDTIGVETNSAKKTFKKLYIGPGDFGLCLLCRQAGYKIIYSPKMCVQHVIPPFRLTKSFWLSRIIGEGHCNAISNKFMPSILLPGWFLNTKRLLNHFIRAKVQRAKGRKGDLIPDEMWYEYYKSLLGMRWVLFKNPGLAKYLWTLGNDGVPDDDFEKVVKKFPKAYQKLALK